VVRSNRAWLVATLAASTAMSVAMPASATALQSASDPLSTSPYRVPAKVRISTQTHVGGWYDPRWRATASSGKAPVLYVSVPNRGTIDVFPGDIHRRHPQMIGQISGLDAPQGIAVDAARRLYVCQRGAGEPVLVFAPGATAPMLQLDTQGKPVTDVTVGPKGDVFVATGQPFGGAVLVYRRGATEPTGLIPIGGDEVRSLKSDRDGNLYLVVAVASDGARPGLNAIIEMQPVRDGWRELQMDWRPGAPLPWSLGFDRRDALVVFQQARPASFLGVYPAHGASKVMAVSHNIPMPSIASFSFNGSGDALYAASTNGRGEGRIYEYAYHSGAPRSAVVNDIGGLGGSIAGIAAAPAPRLPRAWTP
jgi:hypothetical protein